MRARTPISLALLAAVAVGIGYLLVPSHEEVALMQMSDAQYNEAFKHYSSLYEQGDESVGVLVPLIKLYVHYGDPDKAIQALETFTTQHPRSIEGWRRLGELYKASQRPWEYARTLEKLDAIEPSTETERELADLYDFLGRYPEEMKTLARLVASKGYELHEEDYVKLASFYRIDGQLDNAARTIGSFVEARSCHVDIDTLYLAVTLLLEKHEDEKAVAMAGEFLKKYGKDNDAVTLSSLMQQQGRLEAAYALLVPYQGHLESSPALLEQTVAVQLARGRDQDVYNLLSDLTRRGVALPDTMQVAMADLALKYKDYARLEAVLRAAPLADMAQDALFRYANASYQLKKPELAQQMQARLGEHYLRSAPVLAAVLDMIAHDSPKALASLRMLPPDSIPLTEERVLVGSLLLQHGDVKHAAPLFENIPVAVLLDTLDAYQFADLYLQAGMPEKGRARLAEALQSPQPPSIQASIDQAELLLAAGEGREEEARQWLGTHGASSNTLLADAYSLAEHYHRSDIALMLARRLYQTDHTSQNRMQLVDALMLNRRYAEVLEHVDPNSSPQAHMIYMDALTSGIRQIAEMGRKGGQGASDAMLDGFLNPALKRIALSEDEKRSLAYLFEEIGLHGKAEDLFIQLATDQPYDSHDVSELLGFWGEHLSPQALAWVENRAQAASGAEKAAWLKHLNATGHGDRVIAMLEGQPDLPPGVADAYIEALIATHDRQRLPQALARAIAKEKDTQRLRQLASLARQEDLQSVSEKGWRKLYTFNPDDNEAAKELGLLAFDAKHYSEAKPLIEQYLHARHDKGEDDYRVSYAYAELLEHLDKKDEARPYFEQAAAQVAAASPHDVPTLLDEARLLYHNNKVKESMAIYQRLLAQHPEDKTVRADYADMLIETRQFDEASKLLTP